MAVTFITPVDVTPGSTGSFVDVDVSANIPSGATGVVLHFTNQAGVTATYAVRKNGSTDAITDAIVAGVHQWGQIGVDGSRIFEMQTTTTDLKVWLVGAFGDDAVFFDNAIDKSLGSTGSWIDIDISGDTAGDTAIAACFSLLDSAHNLQVGLRKNGSTDAFNNKAESICPYIVGVDGSEILEGYVNSTSIDILLNGYITKEAILNTNAVDRSLGTTGSWTDLSTLSSGATGAIFLLKTTSPYSYGLRKNGSGEDIYADVFRVCQAIVEASSQIIEGKTENGVLDFYEIGYFEAAAPPAGSLLLMNRAIANQGGMRQ